MHSARIERSLRSLAWAPSISRWSSTAGSKPSALDSLLSEVWEDQRPSCPKRSTVGGYLLKTLDEPWQNYVTFHVESLGCAYCRASLDDLDKQTCLDPAK